MPPLGQNHASDQKKPFPLRTMGGDVRSSGGVPFPGAPLPQGAQQASAPASQGKAGKSEEKEGFFSSLFHKKEQPVPPAPPTPQKPVVSTTPQTAGLQGRANIWDKRVPPVDALNNFLAGSVVKPPSQPATPSSVPAPRSGMPLPPKPATPAAVIPQKPVLSTPAPVQPSTPIPVKPPALPVQPKPVIPNKEDSIGIDLGIEQYITPSSTPPAANPVSVKPAAAPVIPKPATPSPVPAPRSGMPLPPKPVAPSSVIPQKPPLSVPVQPTVSRLSSQTAIQPAPQNPSSIFSSNAQSARPAASPAPVAALQKPLPSQSPSVVIPLKTASSVPQVPPKPVPVAPSQTAPIKPQAVSPAPVPKADPVSDLDREQNALSEERSANLSKKSTLDAETQKLVAAKQQIEAEINPILEREKALISAIEECERREGGLQGSERRAVESDRWVKTEERRKVETERWAVKKRLSDTETQIHAHEDAFVALVRREKEIDARIEWIAKEHKRREIQSRLDVAMKEKSAIAARRTALEEKLRSVQTDIGNTESLERTLENDRKKMIAAPAASVEEERAFSDKRYDLEKKQHETEMTRWKFEDDLRQLSDTFAQEDKLFQDAAAKESGIRQELLSVG